MSTRAYGIKYTSVDSTTEVPAAFRQDVKDAVAKGELPAGLKLSVRRRRCTHSWAIDVTVMACPGVKFLNPERVKADHSNDNSWPLPSIRTAEGAALVAKLEAMLGAYNHDGSDSQTDYSDVRFYGGVTVDHDLERAERAPLVAAYELGDAFRDLVEAAA